MKSNGKRVLLAVALATLGAGAMMGASAQTGGTSSAPGQFAAGSQGHHFRGRFGGGPGAPFVAALLRGVHELGKTNPALALTATQKESIQSILKSARPTGAPSAPQYGITVLGNPGDPNYATAIQSVESAATARIQKASSVATQIYGVLTSQQQQALPQALAAIQAQQQARRAKWLQNHQPGATG